MHPRRLIAARALGLGLALLAACANETPQTQRFTALLHARSTSDEPVPGVRFWANGRDLGVTQARGELAVQLRGREGSAVELRAACPPVYRTQTPERQLVLRRVHGATDQDVRDLEIVLTCEPLERLAALVVIATGPDSAGLPIRVDGELVGQTEPDGTAHLLLAAPPRSALRIAFDTTERSLLRPQHPVHSFRLEDEDSVLLVEQAFRRTRPQRRAVRPAPARRAAPRPQRIE